MEGVGGKIFYIKLLQQAKLMLFADYCVGQVCCIFSIPSVGVKSWFSNKPPPAHLAYIERFTSFSRLHPGHHRRLYKLSQHCLDGVQQASIIPVELNQQSIHLIPDFGAIVPARWKSSNVLEEASHFMSALSLTASNIQLCTRTLQCCLVGYNLGNTMQFNK